MEDQKNPRRPQQEPAPVPHRMEAVVAQALERQPEVRIPDGFAARVAARAAAQPLRKTSAWAGFGPRIALFSAALLTAALFALASRATSSVMDLRFDLEMVALIELGLVGFVLTRTGLQE